MITEGARLLDNENARSVLSLDGLLCKRPGNSDHGQGKLAARVAYWTLSQNLQIDASKHGRTGLRYAGRPCAQRDVHNHTCETCVLE